MLKSYEYLSSKCICMCTHMHTQSEMWIIWSLLVIKLKQIFQIISLKLIKNVYSFKAKLGYVIMCDSYVL